MQVLRLNFLVTLATLSFLTRLFFVPSSVTLRAFCHPPCAHPRPALTRQAGAGTCLQDKGMNEGVGPEHHPPPTWAQPGPCASAPPAIRQCRGGVEEEWMQWGRRSSQCVQAPDICYHLPVMIVSEAVGDVRLEGLT